MSYPPECGACIAAVLTAGALLSVGGVVTGGLMDEGIAAAIVSALAAEGVSITIAQVIKSIEDAAEGKLSLENLAAQLCAVGDGPCKGHV